MRTPFPLFLLPLAALLVPFGDAGAAALPPAGLALHSLTLIDCNENGIEDAVDIAFGTSADADQNGIPDECEPSRPEGLLAP